MFSIYNNKIGVRKPDFVFLEDGVEEFEDLPADELVISVHDNHYVFGVAVGLRGVPNVVHGFHLGWVLNEFALSCVELSLLDEFLDEGSGLVWRVIVNDDNFVVLVFLFEDWLQIDFVSFVLSVVEGWDDDAHRQLRVFTDFISILILLSL